MTYTHLLFDLDHTLLDFDRAEDLALTFLLEEAGVASQEIKVYKDHYIPMNRAMWEDLNHGLIFESTGAGTSSGSCFFSGCQRPWSQDLCSN